MSVTTTLVTTRPLSPVPSVNWASRYHSLTVVYTIEEFNVDSKDECDQLNLAHKTKTNKRQCPLSSVQVQDS